MTGRELNITLREMARERGLCDRWYEQWGDDDTLDDCLDRYILGFDFAVDNDYPPLEFIRRHFTKDMLHGHDIYLDEAVDLDAGNGTCVFLGRCRGTVTVTGYRAVTLHVCHDSIINVSCLEGARAFVTYYGSASGEQSCDRYSKCFTYKK